MISTRERTLATIGSFLGCINYIFPIVLYLGRDSMYVQIFTVQSIVLGILFVVVELVLGVIPLVGFIGVPILVLLSFVAWIVLIISAARGKECRLPFIAKLSDAFIQPGKNATVSLVVRYLGRYVDGILGALAAGIGMGAMGIFYKDTTITSAGSWIGTIGYVILTIYLLKTYGYSPGKRVVGLRVVQSNGTSLSWGAVIIRETIGKLLSSIAGIGYLWAAYTPARQTWHDLLAKTIVVIDERR